MKEDEEEKQ